MSAASTASPLPTFFILGAAKAGTTTLFGLLRQHPQVYLPFDKEPMFFSRDDFFARGVRWYGQTYFRGSHHAAARGEASPHYLYWADKVAPRIRASLDMVEPKFVVIVRDPVERAHSWYWNMIMEGQETLPFAEALRQEEKRLSENAADFEYHGSMRYGYARGGRYASQIAAYQAVFPTTSLHIILLEDLQVEADAVLRKLCEFLGIEAGFNFREERGNPAALPRSRRLQALIRRPSGLKRALKTALPIRAGHLLRTALLRANRRPIAPPPLEEEAIAFLRPRLAPEVEKLAKMLGRDLSHWMRA